MLNGQCMVLQLTDKVAAFINELVALQSQQPDSIWLIGSRANGRATQGSDTDLIVFGSEALLSAVRSTLKQPELVDCLIVFNGDNYQDPWNKKSGSLRELQWRKTDANSAEYIGRKWVSDEESSAEFNANLGVFVEFIENAIKIWP